MPTPPLLGYRRTSSPADKGLGKGVDGALKIWMLLEVVDVVVCVLEWLLPDGVEVPCVLWDCCSEFGSLTDGDVA